MTRYVLPRLCAALLAVGFATALPAQVECGGSTPFKVLHFTKTNTSAAGFDHNTRDKSAQMFEDLGVLDNYTVDDTEDASVFDDLSTLATYALIVFSNTSGNSLLNATQRANFEAYISGGGDFLGIHAATDTYRDGTWEFYNQLVGGIVQNGPNHTRNNHVGTMDTIGSHPTMVNLPDPWTKTEEYYYWERNEGFLSPDITEVLRVRETDLDGIVNSYDSARPIAWVQEFSGGARSFYTALGHAASNYTDSDNDFRKHIRDGVCWAVEQEAGLPVEIIDVGVELGAGGDYVFSWQIAGDPAARVELYAQGDSTGTALATLEAPFGRTGQLVYAPPAVPAPAYRLGFFDEDGAVTLSPWLAPPADNASGIEVTYAPGGDLSLQVSERLNGAEAELLDAAGRRVRRLRLAAGPLPLGELGPGVYWLYVRGQRPVGVRVGGG